MIKSLKERELPEAFLFLTFVRTPAVLYAAERVGD